MKPTALKIAIAAASIATAGIITIALVAPSGDAPITPAVAPLISPTPAQPVTPAPAPIQPIKPSAAADY